MSPYSPLQFFLFIISTLIFSTSHGLNITIPLIHRDSIYSPLYNATETIEDRAQRIAKASLDRYEYLSSALSIRPEANLVPGFKSHLFFINFSIGTPWVPQLALMDTASAFLWVKCKPCSPCDHGPKDPPIFDPANSRTIYEVPCEEKCEKCTAPPSPPLPLAEPELPPSLFPMSPEPELSRTAISLSPVVESEPEVPRTATSLSSVSEPEPELPRLAISPPPVAESESDLLPPPADFLIFLTLFFGAQKEWSLWSDKKCKFAVHHGGGRVSEGIYVKDRINFETSVDGRTSVTLKNFLFGCSNYIANRGKDIDNFSGVIGLGPSKPESSLEDFPLIWELGSQFSYCVGRFSDRSYPHNSISFGKNARMIGKETPMYTGDGGYHVNLVNISIGGKILNIGRGVFESISNRNGGMLVDSGLETTFLPNEAMDVIKEEVKSQARLLGMKQVWTTFRLGLLHFELCYRGTVDREGHGFPPIGFHFENDESVVDPVMEVQSFGMFKQVQADVFCLAFRGAWNYVAILGMSAQQRSLRSQPRRTSVYGKLINSRKIVAKAMSPYVPLAFFLFMISTCHGMNITVPLIYRDSVYSPLYNAYESIADRAQRVIKDSHARHEYLSSLLSNDDVRPQGTKLVPGMYSNYFFVNFSIGDPPRPQLALVDTGSPILWVRCKPCEHQWQCIHEPGSFFSKRCKFTIKYLSRDVIQGIYVTDKLTFRISNYYQFVVTVENILFGCSTDTTPPIKGLDYHFSGVMGLGVPYNPNRLINYPSLVTELGSKFSYCIGLLSNPAYPFNQISFGGKAFLLGHSTPYVGVHYYVRIVNISMGGEVMAVVMKAVEKAAFGHGLEEYTSLDLWRYEVCYKGTVDKEAVGFSPMVFHFQDGAQLQVESVGLFAQADDDAFCLAIHGVKVPKGISVIVPLIHRDSVYSPLYNASETISDRAQRIVEASRGRHDYLSLLFSDDVRPQTKLIPGSNILAFFLNISLGDPPLPQLVLMDTGSDFLWVKCKPCNVECKHGPGDPEIYDPAKSKTSYELPCRVGCDACTGWFSKRRCKYTIDYVDGRVSEGTYVTEKLTFQTSNNDRSKVSVPNILFGCSTYTTVRGHKVMDKHFSGIIGLGPVRDPTAELGYPSLVSDLGNKFSYCTGRLSDRYYPYNQISFGGKSHLIGLSTPFNVDTGYYFVNLVNISLGGQMLDIHPQVFQTMSNNRGILIDSGAELNYLSPGALDAVNAEVRKLAAVRKWEEVTFRTFIRGLELYELCYKGSMDIHAYGFPELGYHFQDGAELLVNRIGLFVQVYDDIFCFVLQRTTDYDFSVIGMTAQQGSDIMTKLSYKYGVEIDSGSELSFLYTEVFDVVKAEISKMAESLLVGVPVKLPYELCYKGSVYREARNFPPIGIQFIEEGELMLDNFGMFKQVEDDKFCLAFLRSGSISLIGIMAQQGYNIGYDLAAERLYIKDIDCQTM
ncbi:Aspartic proteinase CDR1 [Linum perenne]